MYLDRSVNYYTKTTTPDSEGLILDSYVFGFTARAQIQPVGNKEAVLKAYGLQIINDEARLMFLPKSRVVVPLNTIKDLKTGLKYEIRGVSPWPIVHTEALLMPYQGSSPDFDAPTITPFVLTDAVDGDPEYSASGLVDFTIQATDSETGVSGYEATEATTPSGTWTSWNGNSLAISDFALSVGDGEKIIYLFVKDGKGNYASANASIIRGVAP